MEKLLIYCFLFSVLKLLLKTEDNGDDDNYDYIYNYILMNNETSEASHIFDVESLYVLSVQANSNKIA